MSRGLAESRDWAQRLIRAGEVRVRGQVVAQPVTLVEDTAEITIDQPPKYVSRGGFKLEGALDQFNVQVAGWVCADVGSSTGGFTDCLLQRGAARVYALDVGTGVLHWKLRNDPRVILREQINVRYVEALAEPIDLAVIDVSFISLTLILTKVFDWMKPNGSIIALIKPQFEAERNQVGKGGIVRDPAVHQAVVEHIQNFAQQHRWPSVGLMDSPILGTDGNKEFLILLKAAPNR